MVRWLVLSCLSLCALLSAAHATERSALVTKCVGVANLCGYFDRETEVEVIAPVFERAMTFSEGLAAVQVRGEYGYIDETGQVVIPPTFDLAGPFFHGLAEVIVDGQAGVIDRSGNTVVAPQFARAVPFTSNTIVVAERDFFQRRIAGSKRLSGLSRGLPLLGGSNAFGLYHIETGWTAPPVFELSLFETEGRGLIWARDAEKDDSLWGLLRSDGNWEIPPTYSNAGRLSEGRSIVAQPSEDGGPALYGALDEDGNLVIPFQFERLGSWSDPWFAQATKDGKKGLITRDGQLVAGRYFDRIEQNYYDGVAPRVYDGTTWKSVAPDGSLIPDQLVGTVFLECPSGLKLEHGENNSLRIVRPDGGKVAYPIEHKFFFKRDCAGPLSVRYKGKWGFAMQDGRMITDPPSFDSQFGFRDGTAIVQIDGLWGVIDRQGTLIIQPIFDEISRSRGALFVEKDGREFWISEKGDEIPEPEQDDTALRAAALSCADGAKKIEKDGGWGMAGPDGETIIAPKYRAISCYRNGLAWVPDDHANAWCPLDANGQPQGKPACQEAYYSVWVSHHFPEPLHSDPYESSVLWNRVLLDYGLGRADEPPYLIGDGVQGRGRLSAVWLFRPSLRR